MLSDYRTTKPDSLACVTSRLSGTAGGHEQVKPVQRPLLVAQPAEAASRERWRHQLGPSARDAGGSTGGMNDQEGVPLAASANESLDGNGTMQQNASCDRRPAAHVIRHEAESAQKGGRASLSRGQTPPCITRGAGRRKAARTRSGRGNEPTMAS
ncbi:hypothetical protein XA68_16817 [Ophiocordyceps unilateralis]|uniref:Uncharacterized protein n=1 Tax=Ophiocordyceps unilateralis TaxID=268505 RepID=A0A2A9PL78_OPHUN|nr:hypothetical protein XA68_16817 [Ophiocordyceps unilateralis]